MSVCPTNICLFLLLFNEDINLEQFFCCLVFDHNVEELGVVWALAVQKPVAFDLYESLINDFECLTEPLLVLSDFFDCAYCKYWSIPVVVGGDRFLLQEAVAFELEVDVELVIAVYLGLSAPEVCAQNGPKTL